MLFIILLLTFIKQRQAAAILSYKVNCWNESAIESSVTIYNAPFLDGANVPIPSCNNYSTIDGYYHNSMCCQNTCATLTCLSSTWYNLNFQHVSSPYVYTCALSSCPSGFIFNGLANTSAGCGGSCPSPPSPPAPPPLPPSPPPPPPPPPPPTSPRAHAKKWTYSIPVGLVCLPYSLFLWLWIHKALQKHAA